MANLLVPSSKYLLGAIIWTITIAVLCLESSSDLPSVKVIGIDKIVHVTFHFVFVNLWYLFFVNNNFTKYFSNLVTKTFFLSLTYGVLIEIAQQLFTKTRQADILDVLANITGAILAVILIKILSQRKKIA